MSYGRNENDEKALSWFKLIVSLTSLWIPQAYPPQLLHFKAFISGKSHEAFRPENVLLINRSYHEGSSLTLFIFFFYHLLPPLHAVFLSFTGAELWAVCFQNPLSPRLPAFLSYPFLSPFCSPVIWLHPGSISSVHLHPSLLIPALVLPLILCWHSSPVGPRRDWTWELFQKNWKLFYKLDQFLDVTHQLMNMKAENIAASGGRNWCCQMRYHSPGVFHLSI